MLAFLAMTTFFLAIPFLVLLLVTRFELPGKDEGHCAHLVVGPTGWGFLDEMLGRLRFSSALAVCVLSGLVFFAVASRHPSLPIMFAIALVVLLFLRAWQHEFITLMSLDDNSFPGRFDKLIWVTLMVFLPPVGFLCLRAYRRTLAPEFETETHAKPSGAPAPDWF